MPALKVAWPATTIPRPRAHLTRHHGAFASSFEHLGHILPKDDLLHCRAGRSASSAPSFLVLWLDHR